MAQCRLTERISIQRLATTTDEQGFKEQQWTDYYTCWSNFKSITGKEYIAAKATQSENIVTFTIRYCKKAKELLNSDATKIYRVVYNNKTYNIEYVTDFQNLHNFIDIKCNELT